MTGQRSTEVNTNMKKSAIISDIKALMREAKDTKPRSVEYWQGYIKACQDVLKAIENTNQPKQRFISRDYEERGWQPK